MTIRSKRWKKIIEATGEVDLVFLLLRVFSLVGGLVWLSIVSLAPHEKVILVRALACFTVYSMCLYLVIFFNPRLLKKVYLVSLFLDMTFLSFLVHAETSFESSFFLGYYLLISLHTIYFGLGFGLMVAAISAVSYVVSIQTMLEHIQWTGLAMRIGFFFLITVPVGLLVEKVQRDKEKIEHFNRTLESTVAKRTKRIGTLLSQERYLREILDTVASINKLLITVPNIDVLLENASRRLVQHGHYGFCWIGLLEDNVISAAYTADSKEKPLVDPPYAVNDPKGFLYQSASAKCIRENRTIIHTSKKEKISSRMWPLLEAAQGFQSVISLPLRAHEKAKPNGVLSIYSWRKEGFDPEEKNMLDELAGDIGFAIDSFRQRDEVTKLMAERTANYEETIFSFVDMIEQRDTYTAGHTERVARYCELIAKEMGVEPEQIQKLYKAAILHDIGKIATPDSVLLKPGKLTRLDYDLIKLHCNAGYEMLSNIEMYKDLATIIRHHHERHDGKGYPDGISGDDIPLLSRILVVADAFDAMTTSRIYKARKNISESLMELERCSSTQFNPDVVRVARKVLAGVDVAGNVNQLPVTDLEKKRFSYFFNDKLTGLYNEDYLRIILNNLDVNNYSCLYILHLQNVPEYNKRYGWAKGDLFIKDFTVELQAKFPDALLFRAYGNEFTLISREHLSITPEQVDSFPGIIGTGITVDIHHIDLSKTKEYTIDKLEKMVIMPSVASRQQTMTESQ